MCTRINKSLLVISSLMILPVCNADEGKLLATAGLHQVEGSGGGGIVPWATITGYETKEGKSISAFSTQISLDDFRLQSSGVAFGVNDKWELTFARQKLDLTSLGGEIRQDILGAKLKLYGDLVYSDYPQVSIGIQHKRLVDKTIAEAVGAGESSGTDIYISATKAHLAAFDGRNLVWSLTGRLTNANQLGLLGFGNQSDDDLELMIEASAGIFFNRNWVAGVEYRKKPSNLSFAEDDWYDIFVSYIPNKNVSLTMAFANAGSIAGSEEQNGIYFSLSGNF